MIEYELCSVKQSHLTFNTTKFDFSLEDVECRKKNPHCVILP